MPMRILKRKSSEIPVFQHNTKGAYLGEFLLASVPVNFCFRDASNLYYWCLYKCAHILVRSLRLLFNDIDSFVLQKYNRPRSIYQYSNMALRLSGQTSIFGVVFFVSKSLFGIEGQKKLENLQFWPESLGAMLEYWYFECGPFIQKPRTHDGLLLIGFLLQERLWIYKSSTHLSSFLLHILCNVPFICSLGINIILLLHRDSI